MTFPTYTAQLEYARETFYGLLDKLNREASENACKGDICVGWDWPTLAIVHPESYAQLRYCQRLAREARAALRSAGLWGQ